MAVRHKSVETKYMEERDAGAARTAQSRSAHVSESARRVDGRRDGQESDAAAYVPARRGRQRRARQRLRDARAAGQPPFTFAYISDTHLYRAHAQPALRARSGQSGRGRQRARSATRLRAVRRRPGAARAARGARSRPADSRRAQGAGEDDGRRARLVLRPGRDVAGACSARPTTRSTGRACMSWC